MLETIDQWLDPWRVKVWDALYRRSEPEARSLLERARRAQGNAGFAAGEAEAVGLCLEFTEFQVNESFAADHDERARHILAALERLSAPARTDHGQAMQARILITLRCWAERYEVDQATEGQLLGLLERVPEADLDHQNWTYLAIWAFDNRNAAILGKAYRKFLTEPFDFMVDFSRQRLKVMLQVVEGRTNSKDIEKLIDLLPHLNHIGWLRHHLIPPLVDSGHWTPELNARLVARERDIIAAGPTAPPRENVLPAAARTNI